MEPRNDIPAEIVEIHNAWKRLFHRWWAIHYTIGLVGTIWISGDTIQFASSRGGASVLNWRKSCGWI